MNLFTWKTKIQKILATSIFSVFLEIYVKNEREMRFRKKLPGKTKERSIERNDCISGASFQLSGSSSKTIKRALEIQDNIIRNVSTHSTVCFQILELTLCASISVHVDRMSMYTKSV